MKKIILTFLAFSFSSVLLYAEECSDTCKISDAPAPALTEYFTNVESVTANVVDALSTATSDISSDQRRERNSVIAGFNSLFSFSNYFSSFDFNISLPITNDVPPEVKRDHERLERKTEELTSILTRSEKRNIAWIVVPNICSGVSHCDFSETESARDIITRIIWNNEQIIELYRSSILDKAYGTIDDRYTLVSDDFRGQIEEYYNKDTLTSCSSCEWGFTDRIREWIQNIWSINSDTKGAIQNWKDAWALMRWWTASPWYEDTEARLLADYLGTQWISSEQAGVVTDNLERYNSWALTSSNPLFNSANYAQNQSENELKTFEETLREKFAENPEDTLPYAEAARVQVWLKDSEDIKRAIRLLHDEQLPAAQVQDTQTQQLQARIIRMHFDILQSIEYLEKNIKRSQEVCNKAGPKWRCEY